jgi:aspartyl/asparaginyl beta-hydroxylase (cupin superfamily)
MKGLEEISKILHNHENRLRALEGGQPKRKKISHSDWYKPGSTIEKIISLINTGFFNSPRLLTDIINKLKTKDFHFKSSDLTLPLRKIVRKGLLTKSKKRLDGTVSSKWMYIKG